MRLIIQRVSSANVKVDSEITGQIVRGLLIMLGVTMEDDEESGGNR